MSKNKKKKECIQVPIYQGERNCICSLPQLAILILVILQFSDYKYDKKNGKFKGADISNDILFIIALYFLSCIECSGRSQYYYPINDACFCR